LLVAAVTAMLLALPAIAGAHLERPSYWPDPAPDRSVSPPAGGKVPKARSLGSAVTGRGPGEVRVVCQGPEGSKSLLRAMRSIRRARTQGFRLRPSLPVRKISAKRARKLRRINRALASKCAFRSVQAAINASGNNDRIVIMPGRYVERRSRRAPVNDPRCNPGMLQENQGGSPTPSYEYQVKCPNDQNLIHIAGRAVKGEPLPEPRADRHGIPQQELGRCIRCNLQIEGSGVRPEDVILDAGKNYLKPMRPTARPGGNTPSSECHTSPDDGVNPCWAKHVVLRADRADGLVGRNFLMRGAREHGFYTEETDGILLDRVKFFWNADYGHLSFTSDHHIVQNCDGFGSGDAVVYPGAAPQTGQYRKKSFYPKRRYNTIIRRCDLHGSAMGYSGSMGNSVRVTNNRFYGNANGLTTDTLSAPGHPGFPADGMRIDHNWFYANNLDVYREDGPFEALVPQPVGTGFFWAGNNDGDFVNNWVFDNWRQGTMLASVPDAVAGEADGAVDPTIHCPTGGGGPAISTSCYNRYEGNHMGQVPPGFRPHPGLRMFGNRTALTADSETAPNGVDFWWDEQPANIGNCWPQNTGPDGTRESLNPDPGLAPVPDQNVPTFLPELCTTPPPPGGSHDPGTSVGDPNSYMAKAPLLLNCFAQWEFRGEGGFSLPGCDWWDTPAQPGTAAARSARRREQAAVARWLDSEAGARLEDWVRGLSGSAVAGSSR
jgi:hypothetical protein